MASSLALGRSPMFIRTIMVTFAKYIFTRKARQFVTTAKYNNDILKLMGDEIWGSTTLKDLSKSLVITAFQLDNGRGNFSLQVFSIYLISNEC